MKIKLGQPKESKSTKIEARSDGGVSVYPTQSKCFYPVFCVEVIFFSISRMSLH
jgi:hypothetical protein